MTVCRHVTTRCRWYSNNVNERDRNVFNILFESTPYELDSEFESERLALHERLLARSSRQLRRQLDSKVAEMQKKMAVLEESHEQLHREIEKCGKGLNNIPSIQPVINSQLTLLTAGVGSTDATILPHTAARTGR